MEFSLSEEQSLLQDSVQRYIQNSYSFEDRKRFIGSEEGFSRDNWKNFAELGWLALPFPEETGGFGGTAVETMILMEEFGKGLVVEPYLASIVLAGSIIEKSESEAIRSTVLSAIMSGDKLAALAFVEPQARFNLSDVETSGTETAGGFVLNGFKAVVIGGPSADYLVVPARTSGGRFDEDGITLFLLEAQADGVVLRNYPTIDGHQASEVNIEKVFVEASHVIGEIGKGFQILEEAIDKGILAVGAEAVGAMEILYKSTVEYCKTREQFGQPIGKFQVLQHRMVDMFMEHEQSKSLLYMAAIKMSAGNEEEKKRSISALKVQVGKSGRFVGQNAIQLHGGMGMTDELNIGHYFKRLTAIETLFGNVDHHLRKYSNVA